MSLTSLLRDSATVRARLNSFIPPAAPTRPEAEPAEVTPARTAPAVPFDRLRHVEDALAGTTTRWVGVAQPRSVRRRPPEPPAVKASPARAHAVEPVVPPSDPDPKRARLIGIAFDYAARMELAHRAPHARQYEWTASKALGAMPAKRRAADTRTIAAAKRACRSWPADEKKRFPAIARHAVRLAPMDFIYYASQMVPIEDKPYDADYDSLADEVCDLLWASDRLWTFASAKSLRLNPGLDGGSIGGADADIIADDTIIELKVSVKPRATRTHLRQLIGYACLASWDPALTSINNLAVFNPRFGTMQEFPFVADPMERMETACFLQDTWRGPRLEPKPLSKVGERWVAARLAKRSYPRYVGCFHAARRRQPERECPFCCNKGYSAISHAEDVELLTRRARSDEAVYEREISRGDVPRASGVRFAGSDLVIKLDDGHADVLRIRRLVVPLVTVPSLAALSAQQRARWRLTADGSAFASDETGESVPMNDIWRSQSHVYEPHRARIVRGTFDAAMEQVRAARAASTGWWLGEQWDGL